MKVCSTWRGNLCFVASTTLSISSASVAGCAFNFFETTFSSLHDQSGFQHRDAVRLSANAISSCNGFNVLPHVAELAPVIHRYLAQNPQTQHLQIDLEELGGVLKDLDLAILNARLEDSALWGTPFYYKKLKKMLKGYLAAHE